MAGVIAAAVILIVPGAVFAWRALDGGGTQPHDVLPADAIGYVRVDLDPSAGQKIEAFRFLRKFPLFSEATGITDENEDLRERLVDGFAAATGCELDFATDVEPWIGNRLGVAVLPPVEGGADPGVALALQTDDQGAAEAAMDKVLGCDGAGAEIGRAYLDGYLIVTDTQDNADRYAESAQASSMRDNTEFTEAMDLLGDPGIASAWFSGTGLFDAFDASLGGSDLTGATGLPSPAESRDLVEDSYRSVALAFRFDDEYAEIASVATGDIYEELDGDGVPADVPDDTTLLVGLAGGNRYITDNWDTIVGSYPDAQEDLDALENETGLSLPDDIATALGDSFVVALDGADLDLESIAHGDLSSLDVGAKVVTDPDAFEDLWDRVQALAADAGESLDGMPVRTTDDGYLIASNDDYADTLLDGGALGDSDAYTTAVKDSADADVVFFLNFDVIEDDVLSALDGEGLDDDEIESIRALEALGYSMHLQDGHTEMTFRVSAD